VVDWLVTLFQNPVVLGLFTTAAVESGKTIYQKLLHAEKNTPEWQLFDSLDRAFFQTETDLSKKHDTEAIQETFFTELFDFSAIFSVGTLKQVFQAALKRTATDAELKVWVANVVKQIALPEHEILFRYLQTLQLLPSELSQQPSKGISILTPSVPIWDNKNILWRDELVDELYVSFSQHPRRIQLVGMGGVGKTEILNKFYAKLALKPADSCFDFVGLVHYNDSIESDITRQIECPAQYHGLKGEKAGLSYLRDVCNEHHVLLLIDDVRAQQRLPRRDDNTLAYLTTLNASVLLASRVYFPQFERVNVTTLPTEECIKIFEKQCGKTISDEEEISLLSKIFEEKAGLNTLIVNRLGSMSRDSGWTMKILFAELDKRGFNIPKAATDDEPLQLEINKLYPLDTDFKYSEISILEAFSSFPPTPLALDLCKEWLSADAEIDPDKCALILAGLAQKTWLVRHEAAEGVSVPFYSMHQMVRAAVREQTKMNQSAHIGLVKACTSSIDMSMDNFEFPKAAQLIPFALTIYNTISVENEAIIYLADNIGGFFEEMANYPLALVWRQKAVNLCETVFGTNSYPTALSYDNIAEVYDDQGDYTSALEWSLKALTLKTDLLRKNHPSIAITCTSIAGIYRIQGNLDAALEWNQRALKIRESEFGENHPVTAITYNNIGLVYIDQSDFSEALEWLMKALDIKERELGKDHLSTASTYNNIALAHKLQGDYINAIEWYKKALLIRESSYGKHHPETATIYNNIACAYASLEQYTKALELYMITLKIYESLLRKDHPDIAGIYNNIATLNFDLGDLTAALSWYMKALPILENELGKEHPSVAIVCNNIAGVFNGLGDKSKALVWARRALKINEKVFGKEHTTVKNNYKAIMFIFSGQGDSACND
jgi:tetratricopeptide (TPR) repeat protein